MKSWDTRYFTYDFVWSSAFYHLYTTLVGHARNASTFKFLLCQDHPSLCHPGMFSKTTPNLPSFSSFLWDLVQAVRSCVLNFPHQAAFPPMLLCVDLHLHWTSGIYHHNTYTASWMYCPLNVTLQHVYTLSTRITLFGLKSRMPPPTPGIIRCCHTRLLNDRTNEWWMKSQIAGWKEKDKN